jgi:hypothetical protein
MRPEAAGARPPPRKAKAHLPKFAQNQSVDMTIAGRQMEGVMLTVAIVGIVILFVTVLVIQCVTVVNDARDARRELDEQIRMLSLVASSVTHTSGRRARNILARARPMGRILEGIKDDAVPRKKRRRASRT